MDAYLAQTNHISLTCSSLVMVKLLCDCFGMSEVPPHFVFLTLIISTCGGLHISISTGGRDDNDNKNS